MQLLLRSWPIAPGSEYAACADGYLQSPQSQLTAPNRSRRPKVWAMPRADRCGQPWLAGLPLVCGR
jgi:hypothetical protein